MNFVFRISYFILLCFSFFSCNTTQPLPDCYKHLSNRILDSNDPISVTYQNESKRLILQSKKNKLRYVFKGILKTNNEIRILIDVRGEDFCADRVFSINKEKQKKILSYLEEKKYPDELVDVDWELSNENLELSNAE